MGPNVNPPNTRKVSSVGGDSAVRRSRQAADYLAAAIIYLQDNVLLAEPLAAERLVPRLLGHRGTRPGNPPGDHPGLRRAEPAHPGPRRRPERDYRLDLDMTAEDN